MTDKDQPRKPGKPAKPEAPGTEAPKTATPAAASGPVVPSTPVSGDAPKPEAKALPPVTSTLVGAGGTLPPMSAKSAPAKPAEAGATPAAKHPEAKPDAAKTGDTRPAAVATPDNKPAAPAPSPVEAKPASPAETRTPVPPRTTPPAPPASPPSRKRGGFWPLFLGGVAAAALGAGATFWAIPRLPEAWRPGPVAEAPAPAPAPDLQALKDEILAELPVNPAPALDDAALAEAVATALRDAQPQIEAAAREAAGDELTRRLAEAPAGSDAPAELAAAVQAQGERLDALDRQVSDLAAAPAPAPASAPAPENGSNSRATGPALEALEADLASVKTQLADLAARPAGATVEAVQAIESKLQAAEAQLAALPGRLDAVEARQAGLAAAARLGEALRGSDAEVSAAAEALAAAGQDDLAQIARDLPTLAELQAGFDQAARDALAATRRTDSSIGAFFAAQTNARSVTPRAGDDPDAIQSRAGAAVESGNLAAALAELEAMPEAGRAAMSGWLTRAEAWVRAHDALGQITQPATSSE